LTPSFAYTCSRCVFTVASHEELRGDLAIGGAARHQSQNLQLPLAERLRRRLRSANPAEQPGGDGRRQHGLSACRRPHRPEELFAGTVLEQVPGRTGLDRGQHVAQSVDGGHPVHTRHPQIHQHDVGPQRVDDGHRLHAVRGLADHLESRIAREHAAQAVAHDGVVVDDHQADHRDTSAGIAGTLADTAVPLPGSASTSSEPASLDTLCRIAMRPNPSDRTAHGSKPTPSSRTSSVTRSSM
jgi:hypothetical protein